MDGAGELHSIHAGTELVGYNNVSRPSVQISILSVVILS